MPPQSTQSAQQYWTTICNAPVAAQLHIAPVGNDQNPGTAAQPLATLHAARAALRRLQTDTSLPPGPIVVSLAPGSYQLTASFALTAQDSGTNQNPIIYRAHPKASVRLTGGQQITNFIPVTNLAALKRLPQSAHSHVLQCDLKAHGITNLGQFTIRGFGHPDVAAPLELFFNDQPMTIARWPNDDYTTIAATPAGQTEPDLRGIEVPHGKDGFHYHGDRPAAWQPDDNIWMHGFWTWNWAESYVRIQSIDTQKRLIRTAEPHGCYGYTAGQRFYFLNILEELDTPGQYYLDHASGILYFWPPAPIESAPTVVSLIEQPLITLDNVSYVAFVGFTLECSRVGAIDISNGSHCLIAACTIRNLANRAVTVQGGANHGIIDCAIYNTDGGIKLTGGDRQTLTPAHHYAQNNDIHHFSRICTCYRTAISLEGVGNRAIHNHVHHAPHIGIIISGNDHLTEFNEIDHLCAETGDCGALYMGRDWTMRGNIIRHNYLHHIQTAHAGGTMGVYQDDCSSGSSIFGNVFYKCDWGVFIGGGRDHTIENNYFIDCSPPITIDARGYTQWPMWRNMVDKTMRERFEQMNPLQPPYIDRYPQLAAVADYYAKNQPIPPEGNRIIRNLAHQWAWLSINGQIPLTMIELQDNYVMNPPHFVDEENENFNLADDSPALKLGIKKLPFNQMGLSNNTFTLTPPN